MRLTGFPMFDGGQGDDLPSQLLEFCRAGNLPIAYTFGTGMAHPTDLFRGALEACAVLGVRTKGLGVRDWLKPRRGNGRQIAGALTRLMTAETRSRCRVLSARFENTDALESLRNVLRNLRPAGVFHQDLLEFPPDELA